MRPLLLEMDGFASFRQQPRSGSDEALRRVTGQRLTQLVFARFATGVDHAPIATGVATAPGAAVGAAVFDSATAVRRGQGGEAVILVRAETDPSPPLTSTGPDRVEGVA